MAAGDFTPWTVVYKAVADFAELTAAAAKARAELAALQKAAERQSTAEALGARKAADAHAADARAIRDEQHALEKAATAGREYNRAIAWGGRPSMDAHLADLERENRLLLLLNRSKQRGFFTPQQEYSFRRSELTQQLLWNRATQQGYYTPDQYLLFLQKQRSAFDGQNAAWRARAAAVREATDAAALFASRSGGVRLSTGTLAASTAGLQNLSDALTGLPDTVTTSVSLQGAGAASQALTDYGAQVASVPSAIETVASFDDAAAGTKLTTYDRALRGLPELIRTKAILDAPGTRDIKINYVGKLMDPGSLTNLNEKINVLGAATAEAQLAALAATQAKLHDSATKTATAEKGLATAIAAAGGAGGGSGAQLTLLGGAADNAGNAALRARRMWGMLGIQLALFGGASHIAAWHLLLDIAIEFAAVAIPAVVTGLVAIAAYAAATAETYQTVYNHVKALNTVATATGAIIPPMTSKMEALKQSMQPVVIQQFGDALNVLSNSGNLVSTMAQRTGGWLDRLSGRFVAATQSGGGFTKFLAIGAKDLQVFGQIGTSIGHIFMNFVKATEVTQVAERLLGVLAVVLKIGAAMTGLKVFGFPVGELSLIIALGAHAAFIYGGLLVTGLKSASLAVTGLAGRFGLLNDAAFATAQRLGATENQLAKIGMASPGIKAIVGDLAQGSPAAYAMAQGLGVTDRNLAKVVAKTPAVERAAEALGASASNVAALAISSAKGGKSVEALATKVAGGTGELEKLMVGLEGASRDAGMLAVALVGTEKAGGALAKLAEASAKLATKAGPLGKIFGLLTKIPIAGWAVLGIAALTGLLVYIDRSKDATQVWLAQMQKSLESLPLAQLQVGLVNALTSVDSALNKQVIRYTELRTEMTGLIETRARFDTAQAAGAAAVARVTRETGTSIGKLNDQIEANRRAQQSVLATVNALASQLGGVLAPETIAAGQHFQALAKLGGNLSTGLGLATAAGVTNAQVMSRNSKVWQGAIQQVKGLIAGYAQFGQSGTLLKNDMNAVTFAGSSQLKAISDLNKAWDTFTAAVGQPRVTFLALAKLFQTFGKDAKVAGAAMTGLGSAAITLQSDFQETYTAANAMLDSLRTAGVPAAQFRNVVKLLVQSLLPLAGNSQSARAQISALAQEAGGPATTNIKSLQDWAGKSKHPIGAMELASNKAAIAISNLGVDAKTAEGLVKNFVNNAITISIAKQLGLGAAAQAAAKAITTYGPSSREARDALDHLANVQDRVNKLTGDALKGTDKYSRALASNAGAIKGASRYRSQLMSDLQGTSEAADAGRRALDRYTTIVQQNAKATSDSHGARSMLIGDIVSAHTSVDGARAAVDRYTHFLLDNKAGTKAGDAARHQLITDLEDAGIHAQKAHDIVDKYTSVIDANKRLTDNAHGTRKQLIKDLEDAGLSAKEAHRLVDGYSTALTKIPTHASTSIKVKGAGTWSVAAESAAAHSLQGKKHALGGYVDMTQGQQGVDSVPAVVMPGEYVIKTSSVGRYGRGLFEALNNQQLASGGMVYRNPFRRAHVQGERVDQGVDYGGSGPIYALGPGVITNTYNSGWPGGAFIGERLTAGPDRGRYTYVAEDVAPNVRVGQHVDAASVIGYLSGQMETGWAAPPGTGSTMAQKFHQESSGSDPGEASTAFGVAYNNLLRSLGAPAGIVHGRISGHVPGGWGSAVGASFKAKQVPPVIGNFHGNPTALGGWADKMWVRSLHAVEQQVANDVQARMANSLSTGFSGPASPGLATVARYLMSHGLSRAAAAGIAGTVAGESGGNPESVGSGGAGLIGWTPPSSAYPILPLVTGHPQRDMGVQLTDMLAYIKRNGSIGDLNQFKDPLAAAYHFSAQYERPAVTGSDVRPSVVRSLYAQGLAGGGMVGPRPGASSPMMDMGMAKGGPVNRNNGLAILRGVAQATTDMNIREAMMLGSWLESRWDDRAVGDHGTSFGPWQIHLPAHKGVSKSHAMNPTWAAKFMLPAYKAGVRRAGHKREPYDAEQAAFFAERPATNYYRSEGTNAVNRGWAATLKLIKQGRGGGHGGGGGGHHPPLPPGSLDVGQRWYRAQAQLRRAAQAQKSAMFALDHRNFPVERHKHKYTWHKLMHEEGRLRTLESELQHDFAPVAAAGQHGQNLHMSDWRSLDRGIFDVRREMDFIPSLHHHARKLFGKAHTANRSMFRAANTAEHYWNLIWGPGSKHHGPGSPGPARPPVMPGTSIPTLSSLITGGPAVASYAGGGPVLPLAPMVSAGPSTYSPASVPAMSGGGPVAAGASRTVSEGAAALGAAGGDNPLFRDIHVHNPLPDRAGDSITRGVQRAAFLAGRGPV